MQVCDLLPQRCGLCLDRSQLAAVIAQRCLILLQVCTWSRLDVLRGLASPDECQAVHAETEVSDQPGHRLAQCMRAWGPMLSAACMTASGLAWLSRMRWPRCTTAAARLRVNTASSHRHRIPLMTGWERLALKDSMVSADVAHTMFVAQQVRSNPCSRCPAHTSQLQHCDQPCYRLYFHQMVHIGS